MPNITNTSFSPFPLPSGSYTSSTTSDFTMTIWNSNGCPKQSISAITDSLPSTSLLFMTETWLLSPSRFPTAWHQYHTYGQPVENSYRGQMGITLLVNPDFPFPVTHFPSESPYVLSCQVGPFLIHCVYLPPATLSATDAMEIIRTLPMQTHSSQTNTIICGDINARHQRLLGDSRTTTRGTLLHEWATENGMICWNSRLAFGVATYCSQSRVHHRTGINFSSIIDLFFSSQELSNPALIVRQDLNMGSDHHPVSLSCVIPTAAPPPPTHPRRLWNLSRLSEPDCRYPSLFRERIKPLHDRLLSYTSPDRPFSTCPPDIDELATALTDTIYTCLDDSVGERKPKLHKNDWFWTPALQSAFDYRESCRRKWHHSVGVDKGLRWQAYSAASDAYRRDISRRRRETWKQFCEKLSSGSITETSHIISRITRGRKITPQFSHPEGPQTAATTMATHLQQVFSGSNLPATRLNPPSIPTGPHNIGLDGCPFDEVSTHLYMFKKLARRKAPGSDHIRTEMLLPIAKDLIPPLTLLFKLCWRWSSVPRAWCTAQVIPIYKKGDPLDPGNFRPISLTSVFRKLLELCIQDTLVSTAPPLDMVQGGFRRNRSTLDQVLCLHELCRQHSEDHYGEAPVLAFLDIKSAYDTVDRAIIWRALETYVSSPMLGLLQSLFDQVSIEVLLSGYSSPAFWPRTGVLQGSILSPFLYSIYINSLPSALRSIRMPLTQRVYDSMPRREFSNLWINCLLYADDVVIIAAPEVMPRLLRKAESHSRELGYRWNPAKCVIVNSPTAHGAPPLRLYGNPLPIETTFNYLGIPINIKGMISTDLLIARNAKSALAAMRGSLCPLGLRSSAFSRLTASRLYATFIRPKFEYGLCICLFTVKQLELLDKAQDQCLRLAFGGHQKASTAVFKHLTFLPHMHERVHTLRLKYLVRALNLPPDTLLSHILSFVSNAPLSRQFRWPKLLRSNPIWNDSEFNGTSSTIETRLTYFNKKSHLKNSILKYRSNKLQKIRHSQSRPVLLLACRPSLGVDPILFVPMSNHERSRIRRWRMGWLPGRPIPCRCGAPHASRRHLLFCLSASRRLVGASPGNNNPLDFVLNLIPRKPPSSSTINSYSVTRWSTWWPALSSLLLEIDIICHPDEEFTGDSLDVSGSIFLTWLHSASSS